MSILVLATLGCAQSDHDPFGASREICSAIPLSAIDLLIAHPESGEAQRVFGYDTVGECSWRNADGDSIRLTARTDSRGVAHARGSLHPGQPFPEIAPYATIDRSSSRTGWTTRVEAWVGDANTFALRISTHTRPEDGAVATVGRKIADLLPTAGVYKSSGETT